MCPRPYRIGLRKAAADRTRARIVAAARRLLSAKRGVAGFSIDAIARAAGVARMTIYYQFGSKEGLLEALFDDLAVRGGMTEMPAVFHRPDSLEALTEFIAVLGRFFDSGRLVIRRLGGLAVLDPVLDKALRTRAERRRDALRMLVGRLIEQHGRPDPKHFDETVDMLFTLTSFEVFDMLAGPNQGPRNVIARVQRLACTVLGFDPR